MPDRLKILLAEDVEIVAEAFVALLSTEPDFEVVGRVGRGDEVLAAARRTQPHVAVLDVDMPGATGIEAAQALKDNVPGCRTLLLTALPGSGHIHRALAAGASGYLVKSTTAARLVDAIRAVADGGTVIDPDLAADALRSGPNPLTDREAQILRLVDSGSSTDSISEQLFLSRGTVRNYLSNVMTKLDAASRVEAVNTAKKQGWL